MLDLAPLQQSLDTLVFGRFPDASSGSGDTKPFRNLFECGQLACELLLAEQEELVARINAADRASNRVRLRTRRYREKADE